jgi:HAD superfamily hydrolase (TIGR01484 family)
LTPAKIRAVFVDVGGTLLDQHGDFYTANGQDLTLAALGKLAERGIAFGIVTGLPPGALAKRFTGASQAYLDLIAYAILENGAAIYRRGGNRLAFRAEELELDWAAKFTAAQSELESVERRLHESKLDFQRFDYSLRLDIAENNLSESRVRDLLAWSTAPVTARVSRGLLIFCPADVDKGEALRFIAHSEGWPLADIMAMGNEDGDASFLEIVGHPRAPGNAKESLKKLILERGGRVSNYSYGRAVHEFISIQCA